MDHWRAVLPNPILTVALHEWVRDFDGTLARVLAHLDLPPDPACTRFMKATATCARSAAPRCASRSTREVWAAGVLTPRSWRR